MTDAAIISPLAVVEAIMIGRRTVKQFLPQPVERGLLQQLIDLAVWASNHRLTEPWCFYVLGDSARLQLSRIAGAITQRKILAAGGEAAVAERKGVDAASTWRSVPALLYITYVT